MKWNNVPRAKTCNTCKWCEFVGAYYIFTCGGKRPEKRTISRVEEIMKKRRRKGGACFNWRVRS